MLTLPHHFGIEVALPVHSLQLPFCCENTWNASKYGSSTLFLKKTRLSKSCSSQNLLSSSNKLTKTLQFHLVLLVEKLDTQPLTKPEKKHIPIGQTSEATFEMDPSQYIKVQSY